MAKASRAKTVNGAERFNSGPKDERDILEERLQSEAFRWHWNAIREERGQLFMVYNNPPNKVIGAKLLGMGLLEGAADLQYLTCDGQTVFIECKLPGEPQRPAQIAFQHKVQSLGFKYYIFETLQGFRDILNLYPHARPLPPIK